MSIEIVQCPYCGQAIEVVVDPSVADQEYIEDCEVCCRPIVLRIRVGEGDQVAIAARREDE